MDMSYVINYVDISAHLSLYNTNSKAHICTSRTIDWSTAWNTYTYISVSKSKQS